MGGTGGTLYPAQGKLVPVQTSLHPGLRSKIFSFSESSNRAHSALVIDERELCWAGMVMVDFVSSEGERSGPEQCPPAQPRL